MILYTESLSLLKLLLKFPGDPLRQASGMVRCWGGMAALPGNDNMQQSYLAVRFAVAFSLLCAHNTQKPREVRDPQKGASSSHVVSCRAVVVDCSRCI